MDKPLSKEELREKVAEIEPHLGGNDGTTLNGWHRCNSALLMNRCYCNHAERVDAIMSLVWSQIEQPREIATILRVRLMRYEDCTDITLLYEDKGDEPCKA